MDEAFAGVGGGEVFWVKQEDHRGQGKYLVVGLWFDPVEVVT